MMFSWCIGTLTNDISTKLSQISSISSKIQATSKQQTLSEFMKSTSFPKKIDLVYTIIDETDIINNNKKIDSIIYIYIYIYIYMN